MNPVPNSAPANFTGNLKTPTDNPKEPGSNPGHSVGNLEYPLEFPGRVYGEDIMEIRQLSQYDSNNKAAPDNNMFFEELHNPLSSKGD